MLAFWQAMWLYVQDMHEGWADMGYQSSNYVVYCMNQSCHAFCTLDGTRCIAFEMLRGHAPLRYHAVCKSNAAGLLPVVHMN